MTESAAKKSRYLTLLVAGLLGFGTNGMFIASALNEPTDMGRWLLVAGWLVTFVVCFAVAWRRYKRMS